MNKLKQLTIIGVLILITLTLSLTAFASSNLDGFLVHQDVNPSKIKVTLLNQDPDPAEPGEIVDVRWKIENYGAGSISNMRVAIEPEFPFSLRPGEKAEKNIGTLEARQIGQNSYVLSWELKVSDSAPEGQHKIPITYTIGSAKVKNEDSKIKVKTRDNLIIIEDIKILPERPRAGEEAEVIINLKNLANSLVSNVKIKLDFNSTDFATIGSTSEKALRAMIPKEKTNVSFKLVVNANTISKIHQIPLVIQFTDDSNEKHILTSYFGLIVENPSEYSINLDETSIYKNKQKGKIVLSFSNIGKSDINFVTMELLESKNYKILSPKTSYLGNLESDDYESTEYEIYTNSKEKNVPLRVKISYKNSFNKNHEEIVELPLKLYSSLEAKKYGLVETKSRGFMFFIIIVGILILWYYKRKKKTTFRKLISDILNKLSKKISKK